MSERFSSIHTRPPGGEYFYELDGEAVASRDRFEICRKVRDLHERKGRPLTGDGFQQVMNYMCPRLPDGFCVRPSKVVRLGIDDVKARTATLFRQRLAMSDDIEARLAACVSCEANTRRGFCVDCSGILQWMYRNFGESRPPVPADRAAGVCVADRVLAAAGASVAARPLTPGAEYPAGCWRLKEVRDADAG